MSVHTNFTYIIIYKHENRLWVMILVLIQFTCLHGVHAVAVPL